MGQGRRGLIILRVLVVIQIFDGARFLASRHGAGRRLLTRGDKDSSDDQHSGESSENVPAILLQRIGCVDRRAKSSAGAVGGLRGRTLALVRSLILTLPLILTLSLPAGVLLRERSFACNPERQPVIVRGSVGSNLHHYAGLLGICELLKSSTRRGSELHRLGHDRNKMLERGHWVRIDVGASRVGKLVNNLEARFARTQRKPKSVTVPVASAFGHRRGVHWLPARGHGRSFHDSGAVWNIELEVALVHLSTRRLGRILHGKDALHFELSLASLKTHDVGDVGYAFEFLAHIVDFN